MDHERESSVIAVLAYWFIGSGILAGVWEWLRQIDGEIVLVGPILFGMIKGSIVGLVSGAIWWGLMMSLSSSETGNRR